MQTLQLQDDSEKNPLKSNEVLSAQFSLYCPAWEIWLPHVKNRYNKTKQKISYSYKVLQLQVKSLCSSVIAM